METNTVEYTNRSTKYNIAICQLYHKDIHGRTQDSNEFIDKHYILEEVVDCDDFYNNSYREMLEEHIRVNAGIIMIRNNVTPYIDEIITNTEMTQQNNINKVSIEIVEPIDLPTGEYVACIKTFWLKIIQRKWKKVFEKRKEKLKKFKNLNNLLKRERFG